MYSFSQILRIQARRFDTLPDTPSLVESMLNQQAGFADQLLSAMRHAFGGHVEKFVNLNSYGRAQVRVCMYVCACAPARIWIVVR